MPKIQLEEIEDYYTYYVQIMRIPDSLFWQSEFRFLERITENKSAYDEWLNYVIRKESERHGRKK